MADKEFSDKLKAAFIKKWERYLTMMDETSASFSFSGSLDKHMLHQGLESMLLQLESLFSDYQIRIIRSSGHPTMQVQLRLEEGLWKPK